MAAALAEMKMAAHHTWPFSFPPAQPRQSRLRSLSERGGKRLQLRVFARGDDDDGFQFLHGGARGDDSGGLVSCGHFGGAGADRVAGQHRADDHVESDGEAGDGGIVFAGVEFGFHVWLLGFGVDCVRALRLLMAHFRVAAPNAQSRCDETAKMPCGTSDLRRFRHLRARIHGIKMRAAGRFLRRQTYFLLAKVQYSRAFWGKNARKCAPMLGFAFPCGRRRIVWQTITGGSACPITFRLRLHCRRNMRAANWLRHSRPIRPAPPPPCWREPRTALPLRRLPNSIPRSSRTSSPRCRRRAARISSTAHRWNWRVNGGATRSIRAIPSAA